MRTELSDPVRRLQGRVRRRLHPPAYSACRAPSVQLYFFPNGDVRPCCINVAHPLGNVGERRLLDIWQGAVRQEMRDRLAADDFSMGCQACEWELSVEGRAGSFPAHFDAKAAHVTSDPASEAWPRWMEFNLSNSCNLQCIQCNGDLSSSIRVHREGRPPMPKVYGDEFFDDLRLFLPHLADAQFAGGEPFLAAENFRVWQLIADEAPHVQCRVVTNATQWNARVRRALDLVPMGIQLSIDGVTRPTYEAIRQGADFAAVLTNIDRFCAYAADVGTTVEVNFCLMRENVHELPDLFRFAEARHMAVNIQVVHTPASSSVATLDREVLAEIHDALLAESDRLAGELSLNAATWQQELARIGAWVAGDGLAAHAEAFGSPPEAVPLPEVVAAEPTWVLGLPAEGSGPYDDLEALDLVAQFSDDGRAHTITVGDADTIVDVSPAVGELVGDDPDALLGRPVDALSQAVENRYGERRSLVVLDQDDDHVDATSVYGGHEVRALTVALRDGDGRAEQARIVLGVRRRPTHGSRDEGSAA